MSINATQIRSLYRSFLRELPLRSLADRSKSPIHQRVRASIQDGSAPPEQAAQFLHYIKSQRVYATLVERYNPGMTMDEEEKIRLTARRVGMDLPDDVVVPGKN